MKYLKVNGDDTWIEYNSDKITSRVLIKSELEKQLKEATARLAEVPEPVSDEELLEWARANYPQMDYSREKQSLEAKVAECTSIIKKLNNG